MKEWHQSFVECLEHSHLGSRVALAVLGVQGCCTTDGRGLWWMVLAGCAEHTTYTWTILLGFSRHLDVPICACTTRWRTNVSRRGTNLAGCSACQLQVLKLAQSCVMQQWHLASALPSSPI